MHKSERHEMMKACRTQKDAFRLYGGFQDSRRQTIIIEEKHYYPFDNIVWRISKLEQIMLDLEKCWLLYYYRYTNIMHTTWS